MEKINSKQNEIVPKVAAAESPIPETIYKQTQTQTTTSVSIKICN
jgi:hypothetical protein